MESDITGFLNLPELMISQDFELPWDHRNAPGLPLKLGIFFFDIKFGLCNNDYMTPGILKGQETKDCKTNC